MRTVVQSQYSFGQGFTYPYLAPASVRRARLEIEATDKFTQFDGRGIRASTEKNIPSSTDCAAWPATLPSQGWPPCPYHGPARPTP